MSAYLIVAAGAVAFQPGTGSSASKPEDTIVVTGERVPRTLRQTASSLHVVTGDEIDAGSADRVTQLLAYVPNIQLGNGSQGPTIRGMDTTGPLQSLPAFLGGNRPRTTLVVDGRATTYNEFIFGAAPLWDLERIEIFRSPQTTTQGQNSIAGAILVYTADPQFETAYRARALIGNYHSRQASVAMTGPVFGDTAAVRIAGDLYYSRTTSKIADRAVGADPNHDVFGVLRAKLLVRPPALPDSRLLLTYSHNESQAPQIVGVSPPFRERRDTSGFYGTFRITSDSLTARASHSTGALSMNLTASAGTSLSKRLAPPGFGQSRNASRDWSTELIANWTRGGDVEFTGGLSHRKVTAQQRIDLSMFAGKPHFSDRQDGTGLFGEARVRLAPRILLTAGLRYQHDRQQRTGTFDTPLRPIDLDYDGSFDALLPKLSIAVDVASELTVGALVQRAFNPGGTTLRFDLGEPDNFEAEHLWDYELFARASLAAGRILINANAFYYDIRNAQRFREILILAPNNRFAGFADLFNVPRARSYGAEASVQYRPGSRLSATLGLGLLRTRILEAGPDYPDFEGRPFDRSPRLTASASAQWLATPSLRLSAQARYHSGYASDPRHSPAGMIGPGKMVDARADYDFGRFSLFGYVRNLFDVYSFRTRSSVVATLEDPRRVGIGVEARF